MVWVEYFSYQSVISCVSRHLMCSIGMSDSWEQSRKNWGNCANFCEEKPSQVPLRKCLWILAICFPWFFFAFAKELGRIFCQSTSGSCDSLHLLGSWAETCFRTERTLKLSSWKKRRETSKWVKNRAAGWRFSEGQVWWEGSGTFIIQLRRKQAINSCAKKTGASGKVNTNFVAICELACCGSPADFLVVLWLRAEGNRQIKHQTQIQTLITCEFSLPCGWKAHLQGTQTFG